MSRCVPTLLECRLKSGCSIASTTICSNIPARARTGAIWRVAAARAASFAPGWRRPITCRAHFAEHQSSQGRRVPILEDDYGRLSLAYRNPADRGGAHQVLQHQGSLYQLAVAGTSRRAPAPNGSETVRRAEHGGIFLRLLSLSFSLLSWRSFMLCGTRCCAWQRSSGWWTSQPKAWMQLWSWAMTITRETARLMQRTCIARGWPPSCGQRTPPASLRRDFRNHRT